MPNVVCLYFICDGGTRPDQRHVTFEDIDKLRQLVKAGPSQEGANAGDSGVSCQFVNALAVAVPWMALRAASDQLLDVCFVNAGVVVDVHRPELKKDKLFTILPDSLLPEEHGALRCQLDGDSNCQENRCEKEQGEGAASDIHDSLDHAEELFRIISAGKIRIQSRIAGPLGNIVIPFFRE